MIKEIDNNNGWDIKGESDISEKFFKDNMKYFNNFAGDMETLLFNIKMEHSKRLFCYPLDSTERKKINKDDLNNAFELFKINQCKKRNEVWEEVQRRMYV
jgi:hypothetical protein